MDIRLISLGHAHIQTSRRIVHFKRVFFPPFFALQGDMPTVFFHVRVDDVENCEILCSEANLAIDRADLGNCTNVVLVLGLPAAITKRELEIFVDPFADGIEGLCLLKEHKCFNSGQAPASVFQYKSMALVFFIDENRLASFKDLYNNMQLPSYSETAPCIVVQLSSLVVHCSSAAALNSSVCHSVSARLSPTMKSNPVSASPGRPYSSKGSTPNQRDKDSLLSHGTALLMQHCVSLSSQLPASVRKGSYNESADTVAQLAALPTCTVCLRRIRCVSTLAHGLSGANDLMVGRSYTCDAKLTFDELNTMDNQKEENEDVVVKMSGAKAASEGCENSSGVRCIVCHIYHEVTASRSIGNPNSSGNATVSLLHRLHSLRMDSTSNSAASAAASDGLAPATTSNSSVDVPAPFVSAVSSSGTAPTGVGRCRTCNLSENIWLCLQCGHTGCGRYTSQHAKAHYQDTLQATCQNTEFSASHNLSLELASGRIWNYEADTFDYIEDESSSYFFASGPTRNTAHSAFHSVSDSTHIILINEPPMDLDRASPTQCKKFLLPSFLYGAAGSGGRQHLSTDLLDPSSSAALGLDDVTTDKINALMNNYERLLEAQLLDQQLYFEKLLARETVRALELSYMPPPSVEKSSAGSANKKNKALAKKASFGEPSSSAATEEKNDDISPLVTTEDAAYSAAAGTSLLTDSQTYREASSAVQNPEVVQYMNEVEQLKLEISTIEMQYREVLEKVKKADEATRGLKKTNDALLKGQQALKEKEIKLKARSAELQVQHAAQVSDLHQQIQDLKFYVRARKEVQESPLKDELKTGTVVTSQRSPPPLSNSSNSNSGGLGGDKKVAKRK